jgi:hypothetical protein
MGITRWFVFPDDGDRRCGLDRLRRRSEATRRNNKCVLGRTYVNANVSGAKGVVPHMQQPNERLRIARERARKTPADIERDTGVFYYDMEDHADELYDAASLADISKVCKYLGLTPRDLFHEGSDDAPQDQKYSFEELAKKIKGYLAVNLLSVEEFADQSGWCVQDFLKDPLVGREWTVRCLKEVGQQIGINWLDALPE